MLWLIVSEFEYYLSVLLGDKVTKINKIESRHFIPSLS